jgi:hypothetical protein
MEAGASPYTSALVDRGLPALSEAYSVSAAKGKPPAAVMRVSCQDPLLEVAAEGLQYNALTRPGVTQRCAYRCGRYPGGTGPL